MTAQTQTHAPVVVGADGSDASLHAVSWAAREATRRHSPLRLVHVVFDEGAAWIGYGGMGLPHDYFVDIREAGRNLLSTAHQVAERQYPSLDISADLAEGMPASTLIEVSRSARMLVLGARGIGGFPRLLVGSTAAAVAAHGACPVVVTRGTDNVAPHEDGAVVLGIDGSPTSEDAVAWAFDAAARRGASLVAVHVWSDWSTQLGSNWFDWDKAQAKAEMLLSQRLAGWRDDYPDVPVTAAVYPERPAQELLALSKNAQLLVVGSRGRGGFRGALLGSTSRTLLHHADCPVMIVRPARP